MTDKPLKNGRKYVDSGFVHDLMDNKTNEHYFLRGHVWPSMRTELPHNVLVILSVTSGAVLLFIRLANHAMLLPLDAAVM